MRRGPGRIAGQTDANGGRLVLLGIEKVETASLVIDNYTSSGRRREHVVISVAGQLPHRPAVDVIGKQVGGVMAVGKKVDLAAHPHGMGVVRDLPRDLHLLFCW